MIQKRIRSHCRRIMLLIVLKKKKFTNNLIKTHQNDLFENCIINSIFKDFLINKVLEISFIKNRFS